MLLETNADPDILLNINRKNLFQILMEFTE